jgi:hypothetical protein
MSREKTVIKIKITENKDEQLQKDEKGMKRTEGRKKERKKERKKLTNKRNRSIIKLPFKGNFNVMLPES